MEIIVFLQDKSSESMNMISREEDNPGLKYPPCRPRRRSQYQQLDCAGVVNVRYGAKVIVNCRFYGVVPCSCNIIERSKRY